jgi:indolepyruvate ferredoxin oxidoreductase beta subunit
MRDPFNILVAGVGGQGNLVCGRVLAEATIQQGLRPVVGDTFGASRRGGSVLTHLRIGTTDWAPLIPRGEVDILLGLEPIETLRAVLDFAGKRTIVIMSLSKVPTVDVSSGRTEYPALDKIVESIEKECKRVYVLDTHESLKESGSTRNLNTFMLGALSAIEENPLPKDVIRKAIETILGDDDINTSAFDLGAQQCKKLLG